MKRKIKLPRLLIEAQFIICQQDVAFMGRLHSIDEGRFLFSISNQYVVSDTFMAGFRAEGEFITIEKLRKDWERRDEKSVVIMAEILEIDEVEEVKLNNLLCRELSDVNNSFEFIPC